MKHKYLIGLLIILLSLGCIQKAPLNQTTSTPAPVSDDVKIKEKIKSSLLGTQITYYDIAGRPLTYNVTEKDIKSFEKLVLEGKTTWKVRIGEELAWDFYYDKQGNEIKREQLFRT